MTTPEQIEKWFEEWKPESLHPEDRYKDMIAFATYCLDMQGKEESWLAYPENKPTEVGFYLVMRDGYDEMNFDWWASDMFLDFTDVIAFMPVPKYKKP